MLILRWNSTRKFIIRTLFFMMAFTNTGCMNTLYEMKAMNTEPCEKERLFYDDPLDFYYNGFEMLYFN